MTVHAYLILAHGHWNQLQKLVTLIDDERNDIFVHVDANARDFDRGKLSTRHSRLIFIERRPVYWAAFSQMDAILRLLKTAVQTGAYSYYHLLSGVDLPLKTQNQIHHFFDNSRKQFIGAVPRESYYSVRHIKFYHPFLENRFYRTSRMLRIADRIFEYVQQAAGINRLKGERITVIDGWTWFSITEDFAAYVLSREEWINATFRNSIVSDELVMQTLAFNHPVFRDSLHDPENLKKGSQRCINWTRGRPYTWGSEKETDNILDEDFNMLIGSPYMFARKFDDGTAPELVERIYNHILSRQNDNQ